MSDLTESAPEKPPAAAPRLLLVLAAVACGGGAFALYQFGMPAGSAAKPKRPPLTEEWTGPAPIRPAEKPAEKPPGEAKPEEKKPDADPGPKPKVFGGLVPPGGGTFQAKRADEERTVVELSNPRRVFGGDGHDDLEIDFEVTRVGIMIAKDAVMVKTRDGTAKFEGSAPGKRGTLKVRGAVPGRYVGPIEVWLVLRRNGEDLISNTVSVK